MVSLSDANTSTPLPSEKWRQLSDSERLNLVKDAMQTRAAAEGANLVVAAAKPDGQIIVSLLKSVPALHRGTLLLDLEEFLKGVIDPALVVWLEPLGDRNSLRNLRGIEVKV